MANTLLHSPADILKAALVGLGGAVAPTNPPADWACYSEGEPDLPDRCVTVYTTQGTDDGRLMTDGELQQHYGVQVRVRADRHAVGYAKAAAIRALISDRAGGLYDYAVTLDGTSYLVHCAAKVGQVLALGKEVPKTKRSLFTVNATITVTVLG